MENEQEIEKKLDLLERKLGRIGYQVNFLYLVVVLVLVIYGVTVILNLIGVMAISGAASYVFPAGVIGLFLLFTLFKRGHAP